MLDRFLTILVRINPAIFDAIFPRGPVIRGDRAALNPQPLPPAEAVQVAAAELANELGRLALETEVRGERPTAS
jgi:hypothetical protein